MAHFAQLDESNTVIQVVVVSNDVAESEEAGIAFLNELYGTEGGWVQCSYSGSIRKQFPGKGYTYDPVGNVFVAPRPFASWLLDQNHDWQPPTPRPSDGRWRWNEETTSWVEA